MLPVALLDIKVTEPPTQKLVGPLLLIVGVGGALFTIIVVGFEVAVQVPSVTDTV